MARQRRSFSPEVKTEVVLEVLSGRKTVAQICRERKLKEAVVSRWKTEFIAGAVQVFSPSDELVRAEERIAELERMVGRLTLELEILKKASGLPVWSLKTNGR